MGVGGGGGGGGGGIEATCVILHCARNIIHKHHSVLFKFQEKKYFNRYMYKVLGSDYIVYHTV